MRVGLFSPMGTGNLGDASTQDAVIFNLKKRLPDIEIYGFSLNTEDTAIRHGIQGFPISRIHWEHSSPSGNKVSPFRAALENNKFVRVFRRLFLRVPQELIFNIQAFRRVRKLNLVIFSGSGQLADEWKKADKHSYSILRWTLLARIAGVPVLFISVGAGPITSSRNRRFIKWALSMAKYRSFRDIESYQYMAAIGFDRSDPIVPDMAHSISDVDIYRKHRSESGNIVVGISPMAYSAPGLWYIQDNEAYYVYLNRLAEFINWLKNNRAEIVLFPSAVPSDSYVINDLRKLYREKFGSTLNDDQNQVQTVTDLLSKISTVDIVIASRFHGILLPFVLYKPVIALSYHPKDVSLMKDMGQEKYCLNIEKFDVHSLIGCFQSIRQNITKVRNHIIDRENEYRKLLDRQYEIVIALCSQK